MKKDKNKIKEPYEPEHTPNPPQIIDPSIKKERNEDDNAIEDREEQPKSMRQDKRQNETVQTKKESGKLLGDETEIEDETTI